MLASDLHRHDQRSPGLERIQCQDIEDEATVANFEEHDDALSDPSTNMHQPYVMMGNKKAYKGCLLKAYFTTTAGSTDHIKCVAGAGKYEESANADVYHDTISDSVLGHPALFLGDPATTLVQCAECIFLAVVLITQIKTNTISKAPSIKHELLSNPCVSLCFQIIHLAQIPPQPEGDWKWTSIGAIWKAHNRALCKTH